MMKAIIKLTVAAMIGAAAGAIAVETTDAHVKLPAAVVTGTPAPARYADWQGATGAAFAARVLARGGGAGPLATAPRAGANPFEGMDKMQHVPARPAGYR
jgi:hypothetical protein